GGHPPGSPQPPIGYTVVWKVTRPAPLSVPCPYTTPFRSGHVFNSVPGSTPGLEALEPSFQQDLNGDGVIGPPPTTTVIESFGATSLVQVGNNYFLEDRKSVV